MPYSDALGVWRDLGLTWATPYKWRSPPNKSIHPSPLLRIVAHYEFDGFLWVRARDSQNNVTQSKRYWPTPLHKVLVDLKTPDYFPQQFIIWEKWIEVMWIPQTRKSRDDPGDTFSLNIEEISK